MEKYRQVSMRLGHGGEREGAGRKKSGKEYQAVKIGLDNNDWATVAALMKSSGKSKSKILSELLSEILKG